MGQVACKVSGLQRHGPFVLRSSIGCQPATHWHLKHEYSTFALFLPHVLAQHSFQCHQFVSSFSVQERAVQIGELPFGSWSREIQQRIIFFKRFVQTAAWHSQVPPSGIAFLLHPTAVFCSSRKLTILEVHLWAVSSHFAMVMGWVQVQPGSFATLVGVCTSDIWWWTPATWGVLFYLLRSSICTKPREACKSWDWTLKGTTSWPKLIWTWKHKVVYMGKDKYENEELLKYGFPEEMWSSIFYYINLHNAYCFRLLTFKSLMDWIWLNDHTSLVASSRCRTSGFMLTNFLQPMCLGLSASGRIVLYIICARHSVEKLRRWRENWNHVAQVRLL